MVAFSFLVAGLVLVAWALCLWLTGHLRDCLPRTRVEIRKPHAIQLCLQLTIYVYWSLYWDEVGRQAPLIVAQLVFAYLFEMLLTWSRGKVWHLRLAPFPIVFSLNLFLWFRDDVFYWQLLLIVVAYLAKEFITWEREGRRVHIFNPSALPLALSSVIFLALGTVETTYGLDLIWSFTLPPHFYEVIFLLGLVVQFLFATTLITFGGTAMMVVLHWLSRLWLGSPYGPQPFDAAVFLGLTLLVTDPATSPRRDLAKLLFGMAYGAGIVIAYLILRMTYQPTYFDKILVVPLVNLLVPWCESLGLRFQEAWTGKWKRRFVPGWAGALVAYVAFFVAIAPTLKYGAADFEDRLPPPAMSLSQAMQDIRVLASAYRYAYPDVIAPFAFGREYRHYCRPSQFSPRDANECLALGRALLEAQSPELALKVLQVAVRLDPQLAPAHRYLGDALLRSAQVNFAVEQFQIAISLDPNDAEAHVKLALALGTLGQDEQAIVELRRAVLLKPHDSSKHMVLGAALLKIGNLDEGITHLRQSVRLNPMNVFAQLQLGNALMMRGQPHEAREHIIRSETLLRRDLFVQRRLRDTAGRGGSYPALSDGP